jgi:diguanylate cyclase (GGDEF)-like protein
VNTALLSSIVNSDSLPSMPVAAFKVLELCRQEDVEIHAVADVIAKDPALTAKLLKVSNSSMFGMSKKVATIQQAMVVLGLRTVKIMSLGFSLVDCMSTRRNSKFDYPLYWRRSLSTAVAARQMAEVIGDVRRDEAFVGGMLCDIGMVAAERHPEGIYAPVIRRHQQIGGQIQLIERAILGITHAQISAMMLANWCLPEILCHAVSAHHGDGYDDIDPRARGIAGVMWAASEIAELFSGDCEPPQLAAVRERAMALTGISAESLDLVLGVLNEQVRETAEMFSVELGAEVSFDDIRQGAMLQLATLSMSAEQERLSAETRAQEARSQLQTLSRLNSTLEEQAHKDALTGVANRRAFEEAIKGMVEAGEASKRDLGLIMIDLDYFKKLNDTYGHQAGDEALRRVGRCLSKISDAARFAARYGGEEFAILVTDSSARELRELAEDVRKSIARIRFQHGSKELSLTASIGAVHVSFAEESIDPEEMIRRADECLYDAKHEGRNRVEITF